MRIDPKFMFGVFAHITDAGVVHIFYGGLATALTPKYIIYGAVPFSVEVLSWHPTLADAAQAMPAKPRKSSSTPVRCVDTGGVYPSASAAARACQAHPSNMATHLAGSIPHKLRGYSFERMEGYSGPLTDAPLPPLKEVKPRRVVTAEEAIAARERINRK